MMTAAHRVANDVEDLEDWLNDANYDHGLNPEVVGFQPNDLCVVVWLNEDGGDSTRLCAARLWGESAERSDIGEIEPKALQFPLRLFVPDSWPAKAVRR